MKWCFVGLWPKVQDRNCKGWQAVHLYRCETLCSPFVFSLTSFSFLIRNNWCIVLKIFGEKVVRFSIRWHFLVNIFYRSFFLFLTCNIKTTLWRMFFVGKNNLTTSQVIKRNNEKGKFLKNSHVRAKISNGYTGFWVGWGVNLAVSQYQFLISGSQTGQWP